MGRLKTRLLLTLAIMGVMFTGFGISSISFDGKKAKDFAKADELRTKLSDLGYIVKDSKESYEIIKN